MIKMASITPVFKKGNKLDTSNYRPVSLIPNINKIFEKAMCSRLSRFLHKFDCLYKKQFGFRNANSTNHALISLTDNIQQTIVNDTVSNNKIEVIHARISTWLLTVPYILTT